jgi:hypothetical protein
MATEYYLCKSIKLALIFSFVSLNVLNLDFSSIHSLQKKRNRLVKDLFKLYESS